MPQTNHCSYAGIGSRRWDDHDTAGYNSVSIEHGKSTHGFKTKQGPRLTLDRIAYERGKYGFVFGRRGITMESCSSYFLPRLVGHSNASYLVSTGGVFPPTSKHFGDLFNEILPEPTQVLPRALELATEISENVSPASSYLNRALMWRDTGSAEAAHLVESRVIYHMFRAS